MLCHMQRWQMMNTVALLKPALTEVDRSIQPPRQGLLNIPIKPSLSFQKTEEKSEILTLCPFSKL